MSRFLNSMKDFIHWEIWNRLKGNNQNVVCAVIIYNHKILAQTAQRNSVIHTDDTQYVVPGGKVEPGESLNAAMHREIKEDWQNIKSKLKKLSIQRRMRCDL